VKESNRLAKIFSIFIFKLVKIVALFPTVPDGSRSLAITHTITLSTAPAQRIPHPQRFLCHLLGTSSNELSSLANKAHHMPVNSHLDLAMAVGVGKADHMAILAGAGKAHRMPILASAWSSKRSYVGR
jgi:hypothetical protein